MRMYFGILAATILMIGAAHAAPGDYARNSKVYRSYIASCKYDVSGSPSLKDEAARKLEKMSEEQYNLQVEACQSTLPRQEATAPVRTVSAPAAHSEEPASEDKPANAPALSSQEDAQLKSLLDRKSVQVLGARPRNSRGFIGDLGAHKALPSNCTEKKVADRELNRMFVRVYCR